MHRSVVWLSATLAVGSVAAGVWAQTPGAPPEAQRGFGAPGGERRGFGGPGQGRRGPGGPMEGPGGMLRMMPLMVALDLDKDGELSTDEIRKASTSLQTLDQNKDGKLGADELRPSFGPGGPGGPGGPRGGGDGGADVVARMLEFDANKDGKLSPAEVPERLRGLFARADGNKDGVLDREELARYAASSGTEPRGPGGGPERPR